MFNMRFIFAIAIFSCWNALTTANDILPEFPQYPNATIPKCQDKDVSMNFSNSVITEIGRDFISSPMITCLDLVNNKIQKIADGAFNKLPKLTNLYLSNNGLFAQDLFAFGGHKTLEILTLDEASLISFRNTVMIRGDFPNLKILSVSKNDFSDLGFTRGTLSQNTTKIPFNKLEILNLSGNKMTGTNFVNLLPTSLYHLLLHDNSLDTLSSLKEGRNVVVLTLDNNKIEYVRHYSNNPSDMGLWTSGLKKLRHFSISKNKIRTIESVAFRDMIDLRYLNLSSNKINSLYPETFANLQSLKTLDLSRNELQKIPEITRETNITLFNLDCNKITNVTANVFARTPKLQQLSLRGNQIAEVDINGFSYLYYLQKLDLSMNKLRTLPKGWTGAFGSLKYLDLSENQFTSLVSLSLTNMLPLVEVYLANNPLEYLDFASFNTLPKNTTVNLVYRSDLKAGIC